MPKVKVKQSVKLANKNTSNLKKAPTEVPLNGVVFRVKTKKK